MTDLINFGFLSTASITKFRALYPLYNAPWFAIPELYRVENSILLSEAPDVWSARQARRPKETHIYANAVQSNKFEFKIDLNNLFMAKFMYRYLYMFPWWINKFVFLFLYRKKMEIEKIFIWSFKMDTANVRNKKKTPFNFLCKNINWNKSISRMILYNIFILFIFDDKREAIK